MQIIQLSQTEDREAWLDFRRDKISGTKVKDVKPLTRGKDRTPVGFWELVASKLAVEKDGESERDRGKRLENEGLKITAEKFKLNFTLDPGVWVSDFSKKIMVSPDASEDSPNPTYAGEVKCLDSKNHIKVVVRDRQLRKNQGEEYNPLESLKVGGTDYSYQAVQYFVVNENLKKLYFSFYDDRVVLDSLMHYTIVIDRANIENEIEEQGKMQQSVLADVQATIKEIKSYEQE